MRKTYFPKKPKAIQYFNSIRVGACLDFATYLENTHNLPTMMFENTSIFLKWIRSERGLQAEILKGVPLSKMCRVHGTIKRGGVQLSYDQLWVKATYRRYRNPFVKHHAFRDRFDPRDLSSLHADHVINRARLRKLPDAWVVLFPVYGANNSRFGSLVEKKLLPLEKGVRQASMDPLPAFKLLCDSMPRVAADLPKQMEVVANWLAVDDSNETVVAQFLSDMNRQVLASL
jgi:hypothetical protein